MKTLITNFIFIALFINTSFAQDNAYTTAMTNACTSLSQANSIEELTSSYNTFSRIAQANNEDWIPKYHATYALFMSGYKSTENDMTKGQQIIDQAQLELNELRALTNSPEALSEVSVLQAYIHIGKIIEDPMVNGQQMTPMVFAELGQAQMLNPANPRTYLIKGIFTLNMPAFIGGGAEPAKPIIEKASQVFENQANDTLLPTWGERETTHTLKQIQLAIQGSN